MESPFAVRLSNKAEKQFQELESGIKERVRRLFSDLEEIPVPFKIYDLKKVKGKADEYRIRLSRFRVIYQISYNEKTVRIAKIERRSDNTYD